MLSNLSNNNSGNTTKSVVEKKHYESIETRLDEMQTEIDANSSAIADNASDIETLDGRVAAVEDNSTFPTLSTDTINPATGDKIDVSSNLDVNGNITADTANFSELSVNNVSFTSVVDDAAQAKSIAETAENKAGEAYDLADALSDELADYITDNEQSFTTGTLNADSVVTDSIAAQTINTNDFETTNAEIDKLYVDTIKATGFLELPTAGQSHYTITVPAKTTASFSGVYTSDNNTDYPFYFTVSDGAVIYKQGSTEIIKDISFDRETGNTKVRVKSSTNLTYISSALDSNPVTIEDGGEAYTDYAFIPQKTGGYLIRGYDDTTTEVYIAGVLRAYAMSVEEEIIERTSVDFLKVNASIELPKDWDEGGTISYSTGEENQYISAQTKAGVTKPTWTSPIHSTIGSLSYSSKLVDEATVASYKGISETRQTQTISITGEASLQQLTAFHWTKNGNYWQPYELTRITIGDNTMWIDPTEANQGIRFYDNQVIADGTWDDAPVEEANAVPVNLVIFDAPSEFSFPITNLGDKTTVHGEITATCFKGNVLGNVTGNADTATNATCFDGHTYADAKADILSGCAADSNMFNGKTYQEACADILAGNAATATNATCFDGKTYAQAKADILSGCASEADNATCFNGCTYAQAKADILSGCASEANNATCFGGCTYAQAKTDILSGCASEANNATCFGGCTYSQAKTDILSGTAAQAHCVDIDSLTTSSYPLIMESTTCELGKSGTCSITFTPSSGNLETTQVSTACIENSGTTKSQYLCATCDLNVDGNAYITGDLTVSGTITTTHSEEVVTPSENIILRDGATTPVASGCYSGFTVTNYDGCDHNLEVGADKDGTLHVGVVGGTMEPVATRATEACMENNYVAHWDSTGTDLVTKGASCTHDLCVNGCATVSNNLTVTGTLTANLTGTADNATKFDGCTYSQAKADILSGNAASATNSTCFDGCTYACAKADILSGNAASATNSTCFDGKTYSEAKSDILSGCASTADNATCFNGCTYACAKADILSGCVADSAKLGNKAASCYIDNSSTAQSKAGNLCIGNPKGTTTTEAGSSGTIFTNYGVHELYSDFPRIDFHYQNYCGDYSTRFIGSDDRFEIITNNGKGCTAHSEYTAYCFLSNGTFTGASTICASTNVYSAGCPVVTTGNIATVAPGYNCTGTSNYVVTTKVCCAEKADCLTCTDLPTTYVDANTSTIDDYVGVRYGCYSGTGIGYPSQYGTIITSQISNAATGRQGVQIAKPSTTCHFNYRLWNTPSVSNTWYQLIDSTGGQTINGNLTIPTACGSFCGNLCGSAQKVCRNAITSNASCHLALLAGNNGADNTCIYVSSACPLTYNPATGVLKACTMCTENGDVQDTKANVTATNIAFTVGQTYDLQTVISCLTHCYNSKPTSYSFYYANNQSFYIQEGGLYAYNYTIEKLDNVDLVNSNYGISKWVITACNGRSWTVTGITTGTADSITWKVVEDVPYATRVSTASCNAEYPLVFSTCCATPAAGNSTLYNDSANNLMYNPSTNTLTTHYIRGTSELVAGDPAACTSTQVGRNGIIVQSGCMELYCSNPFIDFHTNNACASYSHRIISINGYLRVISTNATGCCAATQSANFDFCSNGTFSGACTVIACATCTMYVNGYNAATNNYANLNFQATCCDATTRCNWNMCLCGSDGKLYNPQGFVGPVTGTADNATCFGGCTYAQAKADIAGSVETTPYTCINGVNTGAQDILMTSATGALGIVNASTGTNACPLKYNPATGVLSTCNVEAKSFKPTCYNWSQCITGIKLDGTTLCMCLA